MDRAGNATAAGEVRRMLGAIFLAELGLMLAADRLQLDMTGRAWALVDAAILTAAASIVMWPLVVKSLQVDLETEHAHAQAILDSAPDAIITIADHGIIQAQNRTAQVLFGVAEQDPIGRTGVCQQLRPLTIRRQS